jgi:hypothetical protein
MNRPSVLSSQIHQAIEWLKDNYPAGDGLASIQVEHFPNGRNPRECPYALVTVNGQTLKCTFPNLPLDFNQTWIEES